MRAAGWIAAPLVLAVVVSGVVPGFAETYPARPVRILTGGVGTFHDIVARNLAHRLGERWRTGVVVENHPAAGLTIGTGIAAKATPDGYTLLLADRTSLAAAPSLYKSLRYDVARDFKPIVLVARAPGVVVVQAALPAASLQDFIDYARRQRDPVLFASAGHATFTHLAGLEFAKLANVEIEAVHHRGGGEAAMAVASGHVSFAILTISTVLPHIAAGKVRALAVTSAHRTEAVPDIPTGREAGLAGLETEQWVGIVVPAGTSDAIGEKLNNDIASILRSPDMGDRLREQGATADPGSAKDFAAFIASETSRLKSLIEAANLRAE